MELNVKHNVKCELVLFVSILFKCIFSIVWPLIQYYLKINRLITNTHFIWLSIKTPSGTQIALSAFLKDLCTGREGGGRDVSSIVVTAITKICHRLEWKINKSQWFDSVYDSGSKRALSLSKFRFCLARSISCADSPLSHHHHKQSSSSNNNKRFEFIRGCHDNAASPFPLLLTHSLYLCVCESVSVSTCLWPCGSHIGFQHSCAQCAQYLSRSHLCAKPLLGS